MTSTSSRVRRPSVRPGNGTSGHHTTVRTDRRLVDSSDTQHWSGTWTHFSGRRSGRREPRHFRRSGPGCALAIAPGLSPCLGWVFPRRRGHYDRHLTFRGVPECKIARWKGDFELYLKKWTWKYGRPFGAEVTASYHTGRLRLPLELFPPAKFVHIHRDPYAVFRSSRLTFRVVSSGGYKKNEFPDLPANIRVRIAAAWRPCFDAWGFAVRRHLCGGSAADALTRRCPGASGTGRRGSRRCPPSPRGPGPRTGARKSRPPAPRPGSAHRR